MPDTTHDHNEVKCPLVCRDVLAAKRYAAKVQPDSRAGVPETDQKESKSCTQQVGVDVLTTKSA